MVHAVSGVVECWKIPMMHAVNKVLEYRKLPVVQAVSRQLCVPLCMLVALPVMGGDEWTLDRSSDDVKIFSKRAAGFPLKEFKGECAVNASLGIIRSVMMDHDNYRKWFAMTRRITLMHKASPSSFTLNYIVASPWPVADRETDVVVNVRIDEAAGKGVVLLDAVQSAENTGKHGLVRLNDMHAKFVFTRLDDRRTRAVLYMRVDPRIDMPAGVQNDVLRKYPLDTLRGLKKMVALH